MTRTAIPNLKLFSEVRIIFNEVFYIKIFDRFQDNVRFSIFEHILILKHFPVFETKPTLPFLSIIRFLQNKAHFYNLQNKSLNVKIIS